MDNLHCHNTEKVFLSTLTPINFILSLLIVIHHSFTGSIDWRGNFSPNSYGLTIAIERYLYNFSECAVPIFFFLSAYLFYRTFDGTWSSYVDKIKKRFWSLFVPYIIFSTIGYWKACIFNSDEYSGGGYYWVS